LLLGLVHDWHELRTIHSGKQWSSELGSQQASRLYRSRRRMRRCCQPFPQQVAWSSRSLWKLRSSVAAKSGEARRQLSDTEHSRIVSFINWFSPAVHTLSGKKSTRMLELNRR
jgi:hypothetical protein